MILETTSFRQSGGFSFRVMCPLVKKNPNVRKTMGFRPCWGEKNSWKFGEVFFLVPPPLANAIQEIRH